MTFSERFAVVSEYKIRRKPRINISMHTVLLSDKYNEPPEVFGYLQKLSNPIPYDKLKSFLEKNIPENCVVYTCDGYYKKYSLVLEELRNRFKIKKIDDVSIDDQNEIQEYLQKANSAPDRETKKRVNEYIDDIIEKDKTQKSYYR